MALVEEHITGVCKFSPKGGSSYQLCNLARMHGCDKLLNIVNIQGVPENTTYQN